MSEDKKPASSSIVPFGGDIFQTSLRDRPWGRTVPWHRPRNPFSSHSLPARWKPPAGYWWLLRSVQLPIFKFWRKTETDKSITQIEVAKILRKVLLHQRYRGRSVFGKILRQWTVKKEGLWMFSETNELGRGSNNQNGNLRWFLPWRGGVSRGLECHIPFLKNDFVLKPFRIIPWLWKRVLHLVWALYYVYIVVEMTLNMAK